MTRILFIRSVPLDRDSRSSKMIAAYRKRGHSVVAIIWTRGAPVRPDEDSCACTAPGGYGRKLAGIFSRFRWFCFLARQIVARARTYDFIHAVDLDTAILAVPLACMLRKRVVYDAFDHAGAIFPDGPTASFFAKVERRLIHLSNLTIFPDKARLKQYRVESDPIRHVIISNIPDMDAAPLPPTEDATGPIKIAYVGTLEAMHRGLEYIPDVCTTLANEVEFLVAGLGYLEAFFERASAEIPNLTFVGQVPYTAALQLMQEADCLYGPYLLTTAAHQFAAPNKVYEHLALGRPLITSIGTPPAALVEELRSGFLFDGSREGLVGLLRSIDRAQCREAGAHALRAWQERFSSLRETQLAEFFEHLDNLSLAR